MHELTIAASMITTACQVARRRGADHISRVRCRIGTLRQVDDCLLHEAFLTAREGTECENAVLEIEKAEMSAYCPRCRRHFAVRDWQCACPLCQGEGEDLTGGYELDLVSIDASCEAPTESAGRPDFCGGRQESNHVSDRK